MPVLGITGSIATGKTSFTRALLRCLPAELFDADLEVHGLLAHDPSIRSAIETSFGGGFYSPSGEPERARLRDLIFSDQQKRQRLEAILHPPIRALWTARGESARSHGTWFFVDLPLLYETGAESACDRVVVVACSRASQRRRLATDRGLDPETAARIIAAQLDIESKINRADHLIWNDSTVSCLDGQADLLAHWLSQSYG